MIKKLFIFLFLFTQFSLTSSATHLMGGEITWECLGSGKYVFTLKVYRDCNGVPFNTVGQELRVHYNPNLDSILMPNLVSVTDISPKCNIAGPTIACPANNGMGGGQGAIHEIILQSNPINLPGIPPPTGWVFTWQNCCRNSMAGGGSGNMLYNYNAGQVSDGMTLRAKMFNYQNKNEDPCFDSSPIFAERPSTTICGSQDYSYNHNAYDQELDSLAYFWDEPLNNFAGVFAVNNPAPITFWPGYNITSPLPGPAQNPNNIAATLNQITGEIKFTSFTMGNFVTSVRVDAYKCGILVAQIFREIQIGILPCLNNIAPSVKPPFQNAQGVYTNYCDTVVAGSIVNFNLTAIDVDTLPNGVKQTIFLDASGSTFGTGFVNPNAGCNRPPCATLNLPPPNLGTDSITTTFTWQTTCDHVASNEDCPSNQTTYTFVLKSTDDFCPVPQQNITTISITVVSAVPIMTSPDLRCISVLPNGDITLNWITPPDPGSNFNSYHIYSSTNPGGPYTVVDSIFNYLQTSYTHIGAGGNNQSVYYYVKSRSGCNGKVKNAAVDTLQSMYLSVQNIANVATLNWNPLHNPNIPTTLLPYSIFKEYPAGVWTQVSTTNTTTWSEPINLFNTQINYRVEISDASGCISVSNIVGDTFVDVFANINASNKENSITIFPNPAQNLLNFSLNETKEVFLLTVYNSIGDIVIGQTPIRENNTTVCIETLKSGLYLYTLQNGSAVHSGRFIKE